MSDRPTNAVNWRELLAALRTKHGMTHLDIALTVESHRDSIRNYSYGNTTPSHLVGEKLIALWLATTNLPRERLPMEPATPSVSRSRRL